MASRGRIGATPWEGYDIVHTALDALVPLTMRPRLAIVAGNFVTLTVVPTSGEVETMPLFLLKNLQAADSSECPPSPLYVPTRSSVAGRSTLSSKP